MGEGKCGFEANWNLIAGILCAVVSAAGSAAGLVMQKSAQNEQDALPEDKKWPEANGLVFSPLWFCGFMILVIVPLPLDLAALTLAPQSIISPLTGITIILVQIISPIFLGEEVSYLDWVATILITIGCMCTTAFGSHCSNTYSLDELMSLYEEPVFLIAEALLLSSMVICYYLLCVHIPKKFVEGVYDDEEKRKWGSCCHAYLAAAFAANQNILFKTVGELVERDDTTVWTRPITYVIIIGTVGFATNTLMNLNKGLAMWKATKNLPIYNVLFILSCTTFGAIYYKEYKSMSTIGQVMFCVGVLIICFGIGILTLKEDSEEDAEGSSKVNPMPEEMAAGNTERSTGNKDVGRPPVTGTIAPAKDLLSSPKGALPPIRGASSPVAAEALGIPRSPPVKLPPLTPPPPRFKRPPKGGGTELIRSTETTLNVESIIDRAYLRGP